MHRGLDMRCRRVELPELQQEPAEQEPELTPVRRRHRAAVIERRHQDAPDPEPDLAERGRTPRRRLTEGTCDLDPPQWRICLQ